VNSRVQDTDSGSLQVVSRAISVLQFMADHDGPTVGVTQVANGLGISKAAAHRILVTLQQGGLVQFDPDTRRYRIGSGVLGLADKYRRDLDIAQLSRDAMRELSATTKETVILAIRTGWHRVYVDQVIPSREVIMAVQLGRPYPLHAGCSGKVFLAFMPEEEVQAYVAQPLEKYTDNTVVDAVQLRKELEEIRETRHSISYSERLSGAAAVAAPILASDGMPVAVLSVCGPLDRMRPEMDGHSERLLETVNALSAKLGYRP
jgi:IclR family acetate operon transcriptional repressor